MTTIFRYSIYHNRSGSVLYILRTKNPLRIIINQQSDKFT